MNERSAFNDQSREWINPSKNLVDKALERWSTKKMRADNTSVCIIMFDPPGPPKRDILKSSSTRSQQLGYLPEHDDQPSQHLEIEPVQNLTMYDHSTKELLDIDGLPLPMSGATVLTRYENITESDVQTHNQQQAFASVTEDDSDNMTGNDEPYANSFAESYNSLLSSSLNEDHSYVYNNDASEESDFDDSNSYDNPNTTHQYMDRSHEPVYSLHKLQTRSEQQYNTYASTSSSIPSTSHSMCASYQHNLVDHNYLGGQSHHPSTSNGYTGAPIKGNTAPETISLPFVSSEYLNQSKPSIDQNDITIIENYLSKESQVVEIVKSATGGCNPSTSRNVHESDEISKSNIDESIQINEISSSDNNILRSSLRESSPQLRKLPMHLKRSNVAIQQVATERKVTRSSPATSVRVTRSAGTAKRSHWPVARSLKPKVAVIIHKPPSMAGGRVHKENISVLRKVPVRDLMNRAIVTPIRTRNSEILQQEKNLISQRTLRSQNIPTKDTANKCIHRSTHRQSADVNSLIQQIGKVVSHAKVYPVSSQAKNSAKMNNNNNNHSNNMKNFTCKKQPKRLINRESVQIVKSNDLSSKLQKLSEPLPIAKSSTLRFKVIVAKKSVVEHLSSAARPSVITRRMRLQQ